MFNPGWQDELGIGYGDLGWAASGERLSEETFDRYRAQGGWVILYMMEDENVEAPGPMPASWATTSGRRACCHSWMPWPR